MGDIAELAKIERRRARRQKRILESAESRLDKITRSQSAMREHTIAGSLSTSALESSTHRKEKIAIAEHYPAPTDVRREKYERSLSATSSILSEEQLKKHRPAVRKLIEEQLEEQANQLNAKGFLGGKIPHTVVAIMLHRTSSQPKRSKNPAMRYWNLLHAACMIWLGFLSMYVFISKCGLQQVSQFMIPNHSSPSASTTHHSKTMPFPLFRYFAILEILLLIGKILSTPVQVNNNTAHDTKLSPLQELSSPSSSKSPIINCIQKNGKELFTLLSRVFRDLCIIVFVIGLTPIFLNLIASQ